MHFGRFYRFPVPRLFRFRGFSCASSEVVDETVRSATKTSFFTLTRLELQLRTARVLSTNPPTKCATQSQNSRMTSIRSVMTSGLINLCKKPKRLSVLHVNHGSGISFGIHPLLHPPVFRNDLLSGRAHQAMPNL